MNKNKLFFPQESEKKNMEKNKPWIRVVSDGQGSMDCLFGFPGAFEIVEIRKHCLVLKF